MTWLQWLLRTDTLLLLLGSLFIQGASTDASPIVNVALKASFNSAPYLIELLEAAADESPSVYHPILDRIADGYFDRASTDKELYDTFLKLLEEDKLLDSPEALSSFQLGLSIRNSAPRIEAHYQYYRTFIEPLLQASGGKSCESWLQISGKQYCSPTMELEDASIASFSTQLLPFDRVLGQDASALPSILYTDITTSSFKQFHQTLSTGAKEGKSTYRVRHKPSTAYTRTSLGINGYGVALDLKRTDYIVIDDRQAERTKDESNGSKSKSGDAPLEDRAENVEDLKPLSGSQLADLDLRAASYVASSGRPLDTLLKITQDFPKHSSWLSGINASAEFLKEHKINRQGILPPGFNIMWINGLQIDPRKVDIFSLLDHLRRERKLVSQFVDLALTAPEAIQLLSHSAITEARRDRDVQRYDWRDATEGGDVIVWLNDLEKDKRYKDWPSSLGAFLQRGYPGQLPSVRRDVHNAIVPIDFSDPAQVLLVVEPMQDIIRRKFPIRWGLVPVTKTKEAVEQARVVYHMVETYGLGALMQYLESAIQKKTFGAVDSRVLQSVINKRPVKKDKEALTTKGILNDERYERQISGATSYLARLGADGSSPPMFVNGVPMKQDAEWLPSLSQQVSMDLQVIQRGIFEDTITEDAWIPEVWLANCSLSRNPLIIPEDEQDIKLVNLAAAYQGHEGTINDALPQILASETSEKELWTQLLVIADFGTSAGLEIAAGAIELRKDHANINLVFLHNGDPDSGKAGNMRSLITSSSGFGEDDLKVLVDELRSQQESTHASSSSGAWPDTSAVREALGFRADESGIVINGRRLGPIPSSMKFTKDDFHSLYRYELKKRIAPAGEAAKSLQLLDKIQDPLKAAKLYSLLAVATASDLPEGIFEAPPKIRTDLFNAWNTTHTSFAVGDNTTAVIQMVVTIDPATEVAQRWVPIVKVLSELDGVYTRIFLNPKNKLEELTVKRFYRSVLESRPSFEDDGSLRDLSAKFVGLPRKTLMTMAMDVPPSWLVAPKESIYDLDNIKLSTVSDDTIVDATYELESILIEGHSRDITANQPPRGTQLVLSTAKDPHFADTIIMANLGYFQFKANPGYYNIKLQPGLSEKIFRIDSIGAMGYNAQSGDETTDVTLMSFQGVTLFPRLSRKPGMEEEDVLGTPKARGNDLLAQGAKAVDSILSKVGVKSADTGKYLSSALGGGAQLLERLGRKGANVVSKAGAAPGSKRKHAEINIFSVASGHLYERMLNIMMVSVMRHTNHTVKFWFIEQFLSPSFKSFVPTVAKEYGFEYEMVSYKWPHWLRAQKEKQREIWGYKILFLDVLFPLDLDKVIFVDSDQIVRTDMMDLVQHDLEGAPYGFTPMCDSRVEMEGFRFWKQGYWKSFLRGLPYHISALYVVDLVRFRQMAAGDRLRQQYHQLSADPASLSNLDQDLPNNMQMALPIHSLPQDWLWCETWCSDDALATARTIDLCNNPLTKEPKLDRARRQVPEWTRYDDEIAALASRTHDGSALAGEGAGRVQEEEQIAVDKPAPKEGEKAKESVRDEL